MDVDAPHNAEPVRKMIIPSRNMRLRPYMSASRPQSGIDAISARRYALKTHA
jgi:hypothetical protein